MYLLFTSTQLCRLEKSSCERNWKREKVLIRKLRILNGDLC